MTLVQTKFVQAEPPPHLTEPNTSTSALKRALVLFAHSPSQEAAYKPFRSSDASEKVHSALLERTLEQIRVANLHTSSETAFDLIIATDAPDRVAAMLFASQNPHQSLLPVNIVFLRQTGESFDERLNNTLSSASNLGYEHIVVVGADTPEMSACEIISAFAALSYNESTVVLGESTDGGVYLIGAASGSIAQLLANIRWQSADVFADIVRNVAKHRFHTHFLRTLADMDTLADLVRWLHFSQDVSLTGLRRRLSAILLASRIKTSFLPQSFPVLPRPKRLRLQMQKAPPLL